MENEETKILIDYLKKETERLTNAIKNADENGSMARTAYQEHMLDTFQKFLNKQMGDIGQ